MASNEQIQKYYDALIQTYDVLAEGVTKANQRGMKVSNQFAEEVNKGQHDALELGKKISSGGTDSGQAYAALVEAATAAQGRALSFAQFTYEQSKEAGTESRKQVEKLVEANRQATQAAADLARIWANQNPMTDMWRQTMDAMNPEKNTSKSKASNSAS